MTTDTPIVALDTPAHGDTSASPHLRTTPVRQDFRLSPYLRALLRDRPPEDPLVRQFLPSIDELRALPYEIPIRLATIPRAQSRASSIAIRIACS
jgi:L-lysine 2,3-aminomutase